MVLVKKYGNRRLYDTEESRYVTLEELAAKVRAGTDVQVLDARTGADLTQATLTQVILESRGASRLLPVPLLQQLIRLRNEALAEFFGRYVSAALEIYLYARQGAQQVTPLNPFAMLPFATTNALARLLTVPMLSREPRAGPAAEPPPDASPPPPEPPEPPSEDDVAVLRRELEEVKRELRKLQK
jgi:polyhydroxyalkanoate synthesis repressor PhaR